MRALAQRSAQAAKEIKGLISESKAQVDGGVALVAETGRSLERILAQMAEISAAVHEMASTTQEQSTALQQVNAAIEQMNQVTQQNAAKVEETSAAGRSLSDEADATVAPDRTVPVCRAAAEDGARRLRKAG